MTLGLYGDGAYIALANQDSKGLGVPNHADILYAYGEMRVMAHEPSVMERGLFGEELVDEEDFLEVIEDSDCFILL